jgi:hypothetical protein
MEAQGRRAIRRGARRGGLTLLAACAALVIAGCQGAAPTPQTIIITLPPSTPGPTAAPSAAASTGTPGATATATPVATTPSVSGTTVTQTALDNRWSVSFQMPVVSGVAPAAVTAMNDAITTRVNAYIISFNGNGLPVVASGDSPSTLAGAFSVAFVSPSLLSLRFTVETYITGAAHPTTEAGSLNFDVASGAVIQFPDLFAGPAVALPVIQAQAHTLLAAKLGADLNWPASSTMADFGGAWAFTPGGLELTWSQGAIASEAEGPVTISIAWSALSNVIATPGPADGVVP